jgi:hypothetical protein
MKQFYSIIALFFSIVGVSQAALMTATPLDTNPSTIDYFTFSVSSGNTATVDLYTNSGSAPYNPYLALWTSNGAGDWSLVATNDTMVTNFTKSVNANDAEINQVLAAGSYLVTEFGSGITALGTLLSQGFTGTPGFTGAYTYTLNLNGNVAGLVATTAPAAVPLPAAVWMFGSGLMGFLGLSKRKSQRLAA